MDFLKKYAKWGLLLLVLVLAGFLLTRPTSLEAALDRQPEPFRVGEILDQEPLDTGRTLVLYRNADDPDLLQNAVVEKRGPFYRVIDCNGNLPAVPPHALEQGDLRSQMQISWYDRGRAYVAMLVAFDEDVAAVTLEGQPLRRVPCEEYSFFLGSGSGDAQTYQLFDAAGRELGHYVE